MEAIRGHQRDRTCSRSRRPSAAASRRDCSSCASALVRAASASLSCDCECERDPITFHTQGFIRGALRGAIRGNQEAINETHLHGVTIEFDRRGDTCQSMLRGLCRRLLPRL